MTDFIRRIYNTFRRRTPQELKQGQVSDRERAAKAADLMMKKYDKTLRALHDR